MGLLRRPQPGASCSRSGAQRSYPRRPSADSVVMARAQVCSRSGAPTDLTLRDSDSGLHLPDRHHPTPPLPYTHSVSSTAAALARAANEGCHDMQEVISSDCRLDAICNLELVGFGAAWMLGWISGPS